MIELGGNIVLNGFRELDGAQLIVVKKIVGNYARRMSDLCRKFENLTVTMKAVHAREKSQKYELHVKLMDNGTAYSSETTDFNLFFALDKALAKVENSIS